MNRPTNPQRTPADHQLSARKRPRRPRARNVILSLTITGCLVAASTLAPASWRLNQVNVGQESAAAGPSSADVWCYAYSTALGFWKPVLGAALGARCLFLPDGPKKTSYSCYKTKPVNLGYGLIAAPGARDAIRSGRCFRGEWGWNRSNYRWIRF